MGLALPCLVLLLPASPVPLPFGSRSPPLFPFPHPLPRSYPHSGIYTAAFEPGRGCDQHGPAVAVLARGVHPTGKIRPAVFVPVPMPPPRGQPIDTGYYRLWSRWSPRAGSRPARFGPRRASHRAWRRDSESNGATDPPPSEAISRPIIVGIWVDAMGRGGAKKRRGPRRAATREGPVQLRRPRATKHRPPLPTRFVPFLPLVPRLPSARSDTLRRV